MRRLALALIPATAMWACAETNPLPPGPVYPPPPQPIHMLFGVVTERSQAGAKPVEGVSVTAESCPDGLPTGCPTAQYPVTTTDADGRYSLPSMYAGSKNTIWIFKEGYRSPGDLPACLNHDCYREAVTIAGDTRLDAELVLE